MKNVFLVLASLISISCCLNNSETSYFQSQNCEAKIVIIMDSMVHDIFDWVINNDKKVNKFYSSDVSYGVRLYYDTDTNSNIIQVEGTLTDIIFIKSKDLLGQLSYNDHVFYILENTFELFEVTDSVKEVKIDNEQEVVNDDRFDTHFFGYDEGHYFRFITE